MTRKLARGVVTLLLCVAIVAVAAFYMTAKYDSDQAVKCYDSGAATC